MAFVAGTRKRSYDIELEKVGRGEIVRYKTGSPKLIVEKINLEDKTLTVTWFDDNKVLREMTKYFDFFEYWEIDDND